MREREKGVRSETVSIEGVNIHSFADYRLLMKERKTEI